MVTCTSGKPECGARQQCKDNFRSAAGRPAGLGLARIWASRLGRRPQYRRNTDARFPGLLFGIMVGGFSLAGSLLVGTGGPIWWRFGVGIAKKDSAC